MTRFRVIRGGLDRPSPDSESTDPDNTDAALARRLRSLYAGPGDGYWDGLEATVMAAVRAGRAAPSAAAEWWHTLAQWARPGLAAAAVVIGVVGTVAMQSHGLRTKATVGALVEDPSLVPFSTDDIARAGDSYGSDSASQQARAVADLLSDGVKRRPRAQVERNLPAADPATAANDSVQARRDATFRYVMP